jgi:flagellar biosynthetic protein FliR
VGNDLKLDIGTLYAFLLVLARVSGIFIYLPLPGIRSVNEVARVVLALSTTLVLYPSWPAIAPAGVNIAVLTGWILAEAGIGLAVGLAVAFLAEGFQMGAQIISLQAGYSFATTIDPTSGADSGVLITIAQTTAGLLFFATGLDRQILMIFAQSLTAHPPGQFMVTKSMVNLIVQLGATVFTTGLRLVLPLLGLLLMVEISLGLLARLNSQLHLMTLAFPVKMLMSLVLLGWLVSIFPKVFVQSAGPLLQVIRKLLTA